ncbi:Sucraseferredoxin-like protein [Rhizoclosmatium globosum]|uniref:Sucraseferredoxin-like protein n=1 Tax=Rhizoclosmatium globosum TaxID=329046 RepID=A0A1Y2CZ93_9FUNG|nr:Sucraseferredoxin-like protein [Rhizoclosmatium globosum]|eukprot:ORY52341.1 Sucraseferredoxin-like protein [Rhizoclosmatium globosum]
MSGTTPEEEIAKVLEQLTLEGIPVATDPCLTSLVKTIDMCQPMSIKPYKRHLMFAGGNGLNWSNDISDDLTDESSCQTPEGDSEGSERVDTVSQTEVFLFPQYKGLRGMKLCHGLEASTVVSEWVGKGTVPEKIDTAEVVDLEMDAYVFVCTHKKRDKRCGITGPILVNEFNQTLGDLGLSEKFLSLESLNWRSQIYCKKFPAGVWYGRVIPCHVENIVKQTVLEGKVFKELFRGHGTA